MIIARYAHRLPSNYDTSLIRDRAKVLGPQWDATPQLYFKAFLLREQGKFGAAASSYASLYLWRQDAALRDFLTSGPMQIVAEAFGRPAVHTRIALDARKGAGHAAAFAQVEELDISPDEDLNHLFEVEIEHNREGAERAGIVAVAVGVDPQSWKLTRVAISEGALAGETGTAFEVLHLSRPLLETLPGVAAPGSAAQRQPMEVEA
jgi:hypothetical protein